MLITKILQFFLKFFRFINKYIKMASRYNHDPVLVSQHLKSHNKYLFHPRKTLKISENYKKKSHSLLPRDGQKQRLMNIQQTKMLQSLHKIYNGQGLLSRMQKQSIQNQDYRSRTDKYKKEEMEKQINRENTKLARAILYAEPIIGTKTKWHKQFEQHLQMRKRLCTFSRQEGMNRTQFKNTIKEIKKKIHIPKDRDTIHSIHSNKLTKDNIVDMIFLSKTKD